MSVFLGDLAFAFEMFLIAIGLVVLFWAFKENSKLLKSAGYLLTVGGILMAICTGYYWMSYYFSGVFKTPVVRQASMGHMMQKMGGMMGPGMMGPGMMGPGMMGKGMMGRGIRSGGCVMQGMMHEMMAGCWKQMPAGSKMDERMMTKMRSCMMNRMQGTPKLESEEEHEQHHE